MCSDLAAHIDGFIACVAHTVVVQSEPVKGSTADALAAAHTALEAALRLVRPGVGHVPTLPTLPSSSVMSGSSLGVFMSAHGPGQNFAATEAMLPPPQIKAAVFASYKDRTNGPDFLAPNIFNRSLGGFYWSSLVCGT